MSQNKAHFCVGPVALIVFSLTLLPVYSFAKDTGDLSYIYSKLPLVYHAKDVTARVLADANMLKSAEKAFPHITRVYINLNPNYTILIGYSPSKRVVTGKSKSQILNEYNTYMDSIKHKREYQGYTFTYHMLKKQPIGYTYVCNYSVNRKKWVDIAMVLVVNKHHVLNVMVTGSAQSLPVKEVVYVNNQLNMLRRMILVKEGRITFSATGQLIEYDILDVNLINIALAVLLCTCILLLHRKWFYIKTGRMTTIYSTIVTVLFGICTMTVLLYNCISDRYGSGLMNLALAPLYISIALIHGYSLYKKSSTVILGAITYFIAIELVTMTRNFIGINLLNVNQITVRTIVTILLILILVAASERKPQSKIIDQASPSPEEV